MATPTAKEGVVRAGELYTLDELAARTGLKKHALREARRNGLTVRRIGRRSYVSGDDFLGWFNQRAKSI